jgi:cell division protein FtsZ
MAESVNICVVGTTDVNDGIPHYAKTKADRSGLRTVPSTRTASDETRKCFPPVHQSKLSNDKKGQDQKEFDFMSREEQRGYFDQTEQNLFEGEDLDVPTYLRRGIKIRL